MRPTVPLPPVGRGQRGRRPGARSAGSSALLAGLLVVLATLALATPVGRATAAAASPAAIAATPAGAIPAAPAAGPTAATTTVEAASPSTSVATSTPDPARDRIHRIIALLIAMAVLLLVLTVLFWRRTRPLFPALEGLDHLGSRKGRARARGQQRAARLGRSPDRPPADELYAQPTPDEPVAPPVPGPAPAPAERPAVAAGAPLVRPRHGGVRPPSPAPTPGGQAEPGAEPLPSDGDG